MRLPVLDVHPLSILLIGVLIAGGFGFAAAQGLQFGPEEEPVGEALNVPDETVNVPDETVDVPDEAMATDVDYGQPLSGDDAASLISGNTLTGWRNGNPFTEYYDEDGTVRGTSNNAFYTGIWTVDDDRLCVDYEFGSVTDYDGCATAMVPRSGEIVLQDDAGTEIRAYEFEVGNPADL